MIRMNLVTNIAFALVIVGALNWGLVGFFAFDLVAAIFGPMSMGARIVYALVGLSALCVLAWRFIPQKTVDVASSPRT